MKSTTLAPVKGRVTIQSTGRPKTKSPAQPTPSSSSSSLPMSARSRNDTETIERRRAALVLQREIQRRQAFENKPHSIIVTSSDTVLPSPSSSSSSSSSSTHKDGFSSLTRSTVVPSSTIHSSPKGTIQGKAKVLKNIKPKDVKELSHQTINIDDHHMNTKDETIGSNDGKTAFSALSSSPMVSSSSSSITHSDTNPTSSVISTVTATVPTVSGTLPPLVPSGVPTNTQNITIDTKIGASSSPPSSSSSRRGTIRSTKNDSRSDTPSNIPTDEDRNNRNDGTSSTTTLTTDATVIKNTVSMLTSPLSLPPLSSDRFGTIIRTKTTESTSTDVPPAVTKEALVSYSSPSSFLSPQSDNNNMTTSTDDTFTVPVITVPSDTSSSEATTKTNPVSNSNGNNPFIYDFYDHLLTDDELKKLAYPPLLPLPATNSSSSSSLSYTDTYMRTTESSASDNETTVQPSPSFSSSAPVEYTPPTPRPNDYSTNFLLHLYNTLTINRTPNLVKDDLLRIMNQRRYNYPVSFQVSLVNDFLSELRTIPVPKPPEENSTRIFNEQNNQAQVSSSFAVTSISTTNSSNGKNTISSSTDKQGNSARMVTMATQTVPLSSFSEAIHEGKIPLQPDLSLSQLAEYAILHDQTNNLSTGSNSKVSTPSSASSPTTLSSTNVTTITADPLAGWLWFISLKRDLEIIWQAAMLYEYHQEKTGINTVRSTASSSSSSASATMDGTEMMENNIFVYSMFPELVQIDHIIRVFERLRIHELSLPALACGVRAIVGLLGYGGLNQVTEGILSMYYPSTWRSTTRMRLIREALSSLGTIGFGNGESTLVGTPVDFQWLYRTAVKDETGATVTLPMDDDDNDTTTTQATENNDNDDVLLPLPLRCTVFSSSAEDLIPSLHALTGCEQTVQRLGYDKDGICYGPSVRIVISAEDFPNRLVQASETLYNAYASLRENERRKEEEKRIIDYAEHINEPIGGRTEDTVRSKTTESSGTITDSTTTMTLPPLLSPWVNLSYTAVLSLGPVTYDILDMALTDTLTVTNLESVYHNIPSHQYRQRCDFLRRNISTPITIIKKDRSGNEYEYMNPLLSPEEKEILDIHEVSSITVPTLRRTLAHMRECYFYSVYMNMFTGRPTNTTMDTVTEPTGTGSIDLATMNQEMQTTNTYLHITAVEYPPVNTYRTLGSIAVDRSSQQPLGYTVPLPLARSSSLLTGTRRYVRGIAWNKLRNAEPLQSSELYPYTNQSTILRLWSRLIHSDEDHARHKRAQEETRRAIAAVSLANLVSP